ncbi:MAG: hypothetical protein HJJLKODD_00754 [Phycisphaerae bacterium]|nr:hypothetical protein [Phycisphaerae bacterium]
MRSSELIYVGLNSRVAALARASGELVWSWKASQGRGYVSLLVEDDLLIVSVMGYTYGLDPRTGQELWFNKLSGFGSGVACVASTRGHSGHTQAMQAADLEAQRDAGS